jgi:hypothetical protein
LQRWQGIWLAATDEKQEGKFIWENSQTPVVYSNFKHGELDNNEGFLGLFGK